MTSSSSASEEHGQDIEETSGSRSGEKSARSVHFVQFLKLLFTLTSRTTSFIIGCVVWTIVCLVLLSIDFTSSAELPDDPDPSRFEVEYGYPQLVTIAYTFQDQMNISFGPKNDLTDQIKSVWDGIITSLPDIKTRPIEQYADKDEMANLFRNVYTGSNIGFFFDAANTTNTDVTILSKFLGEDTQIGLLGAAFQAGSTKIVPSKQFPEIALSRQAYSTPGGGMTFGADALTGFYPQLALTSICYTFGGILFNLCKTKVLFLLRVSGMNPYMMALAIIVLLMVIMTPLSFLITIFVCFVAKSSKGSNFLIVFVTTFLYEVGQIFFTCLLFILFFPKAGFPLVVVVCILVPCVFLVLGTMRTFASISDAVFIALSILFPQESYMNTFWIFSQIRLNHGPISFDLMNVEFNGLSMSQLIGFQFINIIIYGGLCVISYLYCPRRFGRSPMKCGQCKSSPSDGSVANDSKSALVMDSLRKEYKVHGKKIAALDSVSCTIGDGETIIIMGSNGAGKSTLISLITGMITPDSGSIVAWDHRIFNDFSRFYENMGVVFQDNVLIDVLTVKDHFFLIGRIRMMSETEIQARMDLLLGSLHLQDCLSKRSSTLSGGQKRKLCIALALLPNPAFLIMDEPTAGVDVQARQMIWKTVAGFNATSMITTHSLEEAESICTRMFIMSKGKIAFHGTPTELRQQMKSGYILSINNENVDYEGLLGCIRKVVPEAEVDPDINTHIRLPDDMRMTDVLAELEKNKKRLHLTNYTVHVTNLEELLVQLVQTDECAM